MGPFNSWIIIVVFFGIHSAVSSYDKNTETDTVDAHPCMGFTGDDCNFRESSMLKIIYQITDVEECIKACAITYQGNCTYYIYDDFSHHDKCTLLTGPFDPLKDFCTKLNGPVTPPLQTCRESTDPCKVSYTYY